MLGYKVIFYKKISGKTLFPGITPKQRSMTNEKKTAGIERKSTT
ncbi:MAG: hypothetical protein ACD_24C00348G0002 [uncultured bacterium]|nr:MAG: hypothetical protein ACD_24C00348G0002 [uncultured bacterium]